TLAMNALGQANVNLAEALCARAQQAIDQHDTLAATLLLTRARELAPGSLRVQALTLARPRAVVTFGRRVQAFDVRVAACAFRPDGSLIAATQAGQLAPAVDGTHDTACSVCFSPDAAWLYTVEPTSGVLQQIDTRTGLLEQQWSMHGEHEFTRVLAVSPDGTRIAVSSLEGVHIATPGKTELRAHYTVIGGYSQLALHPDEEHTVVGMRFGLAMLQSGAGAAPWLRTPNEDEVGQIAWHPDGDHIAFASGDTRLHLAYRRLSDSTRTVDLGATINRLAWSPDGKMLAVACGDGTLRLWCARTWRELAMLAGHGNSAEALAFSADGLQLAVGGSDGTVTVWHVHPPPDAPMHDDPYGRALQFSPDGRHVMISSSGLWAMPLPVFDVATGEEAATLSSGRINTHAAFVEQGIAQASQSAGMLLLPGRESTPVDAGTAIQRLAVSGSGRFVALGCEPPLRVDARDGTTTPLIASDGDALYDPELALDDSGQSAAVATVAALNVGAPGADQLSWCDHSVEDARDMAFDHAGQRIAWMNVDRLAVMDARSGNELWHRDAFNTDGAVAITRDDRLLVAGSTTTSGNLGGARLLAVHDLRDGTLLARVPAPPQQFAKQLALSPDGLTLACTFESAMLLLFGGTLPDSVAAAERESGLRLSGPGGLDVLPATASGPLDAAGSAPTAAAHDPALAALWPAWWTAHRYVMTRSDDEIHPFGYVRALRSINARLAWCDHLAQQAADNDRLVELLDEERIALEELRGMMPVAEDEWFADGFAPLREWLAKWPAHRRAALVADIVRQD
ncbi:MAG: WD40 repeat domain-containing protein, partial [Planctomycetota bacterium]